MAYDVECVVDMHTFKQSGYIVRDELQFRSNDEVFETVEERLAVLTLYCVFSSSGPRMVAMYRAALYVLLPQLDQYI